MKIGIVIAMDKEFIRIKSLLHDVSQTEKHGFTFVTGTSGANTVVMMQCGIGKVNAAMGAAELISLFEPDAVISTGVAGGASTQLERMEVVVSSQTCYHDVYCGSEQAYGQIPGMPARFDADSDLLAKACAIDCGTKITPGLIVTGDWFVDSREKMSSCHRRGVRFISFRIISDIPLKDDKAQQYYDFWEKMAEDSFGVTKAFMESI